MGPKSLHDLPKFVEQMNQDNGDQNPHLLIPVSRAASQRLLFRRNLELEATGRHSLQRALLGWVPKSCPLLPWASHSGSNMLYRSTPPGALGIGQDMATPMAVVKPH